MSAPLVSKEAYRPLNRWDHDRIQPGNVHSVGDSITGIRLKHSFPDLPIRWDPTYSGVVNGELMGDNNCDGYPGLGHFNEGMGEPRVFDSNWPSYREFRTAHGWVYQDLRPEDRYDEPLLQSTPNAKWDNRVAETYRIRRSGFDFLPLPGGYHPSPGQTPRGGLVPEITDVVTRENDVIETPQHLAALSSNITTYEGSNMHRLYGRILPRPSRPMFDQANTGMINKR